MTIDLVIDVVMDLGFWCCVCFIVVDLWKQKCLTKSIWMLTQHLNYIAQRLKVKVHINYGVMVWSKSLQIMVWSTCQFTNLTITKQVHDNSMYAPISYLQYNVIYSNMKILPYNHFVIDMWEPKPYISHGFKIMNSRFQNSSHWSKWLLLINTKYINLVKIPKILSTELSVDWIISFPWYESLCSWVHYLF